MLIKERSSQLPLYAQIKGALQREIETGMKPGEALPPEPELQKRFGVSRITVRRALDELVSEGLIVRQQGRGTFVREPQIAQELARLETWADMIRHMGHEPKTVSCEMDRIEPSREIAATLGAEPGERVLRIRRLRYADDQPICLMTNYVREALVPDVMEHGLVDDSLHATVIARGMLPAQAVDKVEARAASEGEAELLQIPAWSPLLQVTRIAYDPAGRPLYIAVVANRADRYTYTIHFQGSQMRAGEVPASDGAKRTTGMADEQ